MANADKDAKQIASLRKRGWLSAKDLAQAGYRAQDADPKGNLAEHAEAIDHKMSDYFDDVLEDVQAVVRSPGPDGYIRMDAEGQKFDASVVNMIDDNLAVPTSEGYFLSREGVTGMKRRGLLTMEPEAAKGWADEGVRQHAQAELKRDRLKPKEIKPESKDITERKARTRE